MANITEILGTDSVSSSRPVINSNFELLNDEIASITALLDPSTSTLSNVNSVASKALSLASGGTNIATINLTEAAFFVESSFSEKLSIGGKLVKNGVVGSASVPSTNYAPTSIAATTYFVDNTFTLPTGDEGQEVTIINRSASAINVQAGVGVSLGVTSIELAGAPTSNANVTLRCFNNVWYVIGSYSATIA